MRRGRAGARSIAREAVVLVDRCIRVDAEGKSWS